MGSRNPERVKARATEIETAISDGNLALAAAYCDAGPWWRNAMLAHLCAEAEETVQALYNTADAFRDTLSAIASEMAREALERVVGTDAAFEAYFRVLNGGDNNLFEAGERAAWESAFLELHNGESEDTAREAADLGAEKAIRQLAEL